MLDVRLRNKKNGVALGMITRSHCADFPQNQDEKATICSRRTKNPPTNTAPKPEGNTDSSLIEQEEAADASPGSERRSAVEGKSVGWRVDLGGGRVLKKTNKK